jgi:hypothetical protein
MKTVAKAAHYVAWTFACLQMVVLLSACVVGFSELQLGLAVIGQVAFFGFLFISTLAEEPGAAVRQEVRRG